MIFSTHRLISNSTDDGLNAHLLNVNNRPLKISGSKTYLLFQITVTVLKRRG